MRVPVGNNTSIQELATAINELYDALQWQDPTNNRDLGKIEPASQFLRSGQIAYADGSTWNPNSQGSGYYRYTGSAWVKSIETGDAFTTSIDADKLDGHHWSEIPNVALTKYFESSAQSITTTLTIAHGLGVVPKLFQVILKCVTGELSYTANNLVIVGPHFIGSSGSDATLSIIPDATNLNIVFSNPFNVVLPRLDTRVNVIITNVNWNIIFRAWA